MHLSCWDFNCSNIERCGMRGRTLQDAFVILDEAQNVTSGQMKMFLTRLGVNSRAVVTGDKTQIDLPSREESGLIEIERILKPIGGVCVVSLNESDVVRHRLVRDIIRAYEKEEDGSGRQPVGDSRCVDRGLRFLGIPTELIIHNISSAHGEHHTPGCDAVCRERD